MIKLLLASHWKVISFLLILHKVTNFAMVSEYSSLKGDGYLNDPNLYKVEMLLLNVYLSVSILAVDIHLIIRVLATQFLTYSF